MAVIDTLGPAARGRRLDTFGLLTESRPDDDLRAHLERDGYLFIRGLLDREAVRRGREDLLAQPELTQTYPMRSDAIKAVVHGPRIMAFFTGLFGTEARSYDFIWLRHQPPGHGIAAALRHRVHGPRHARRADRLDPVRRHPPPRPAA